MRHPKLPWMITIVALVLAMGGASYGAAQRYIITQKNQIKPSVLRQLKGARGPAGAPGAPGAQGPAGPQGPPGVGGGGTSGFYGSVTIANGAISVSQTNGGITVTSPSVGTYCLTGAGTGKAIFVTNWAQYGFVGQAGVTVCPGAYQVFTIAPNGAAVAGNFNYYIP
jgi:hypothetical protein